MRLAIEEGAEILTLPCVLEAPNTTAAERLANQFVANSGLGHSPIEYVEGIKLLLSYGWTDQKVADRFGKSRQWVSNILELAGAPSDVQAAITNGTVSATQAIKLIRSEGADAGAVIAKVAAEQRAAGKEKVRITAKNFTPAKPAAPKLTPPKPVVGLLGAAREVLRIWESGSLDSDFTEAMECLRAIVGEVAS